MAYTLNSSHPAFGAFLEAWLFKEGTGVPASFGGAVPISEGGTPSWTLEGSGYGYTLADTDYLQLCLDVDFLSSGKSQTFVFRSRLTSGAPGSNRFGVDGGSPWLCGGSFPDADTNIYFNWGTDVANVSRLTVSGESFDTTLDTFVVRVNASEIRMWRNGTDIGHTTGGAPPNKANAFFSFTINHWQFNTGCPQFVDLMVILNGTPSDSTCASLSADPWDLFVAPVELGAEEDIEIEVEATLRGTKHFYSDVEVEVEAEATTMSTGRMWLGVKMDIIQEVNAPLTVLFDIAPVVVDLQPLTVLFDILDENPDALEVSFEIVAESLVASRMNNDVQAPVAHVSL